MIQVHIRLHGVLRDKLPVEARGKTDLALPESSTVQDLLEYFKVQNLVTVAVNDEVEIDAAHRLNDGDRVEMFRVGGGG